MSPDKRDVDSFQNVSFQSYPEESEPEMKKTFAWFLLALLISLMVVPGNAQAASSQACWGQATAVFAQMGEMGQHASEQETPRLGIIRLAWLLYEQGAIDAPTIQALGAFVAAELGLSIEACQ
jgi:hypothetical protein